MASAGAAFGPVRAPAAAGVVQHALCAQGAVAALAGAAWPPPAAAAAPAGCMERVEGPN